MPRSTGVFRLGSSPNFLQVLVNNYKGPPRCHMCHRFLKQHHVTEKDGYEEMGVYFYCGNIECVRKVIDRDNESSPPTVRLKDYMKKFGYQIDK